MEEPPNHNDVRSERSSSFTDVNDCSNLWNEDEVVKMDVFTACSIGEYNCLQQYLADGMELADLDRPNIGGWTPLMYAAYVGHDTIVNLLLDYHVDVNARTTTKYGATPLMLAASCGNESIVYFLLQSGAKIDIQDKRGWTCLFYATYQGHHKVAKLLLENGADKEIREIRLGLTPLLLAAREGHEVIFEELVRCGANMNSRTNLGEDIRFLAWQQGNMAVVNIIDQQAFLNLPNYLLRSEPGLLPDVNELAEEKVHGWLQGKNGIPNTGIRDGPEAFKKLMSSQNKNGKPVSIPTIMGKQERISHIMGSPHLLSNTPGTPEGNVGSFEEHFFINCGRTVESARLHKQLEKVNSFDKENNRSLQVQTNGILPNKPTVASFLQELKLTKYIPMFDKQDVDFGTLLTLTDSDLKEIGISLLGPRKKIQTALSRWKEQNEHSNTTSNSQCLEKLQWQASQTEAQLYLATSEVQKLQKQLVQEKDLRLFEEGCLIEEKAKRQEIYIRVGKLEEQWKQIQGEVEILKALGQEMKGNYNLSQEQAKELCGKLESSVANLDNFVRLGVTGTSAILCGHQYSQSGNSSESSGNSSF